MDIVENLYLGMSTVLKTADVALPLIGSVPLPVYVLYCLVGCFIGTLVGVLPGLGPIATITMLLPITFGLDPIGALIMLAGIYYGAQYGGSTTAILVNVPGEANSVVTAIDGYQMAKNGRAGVALGIAAIGSFFAGCVSTLIIAALSLPLTSLALLFGPVEYFSLMVVGLVLAIVLAHGSIPKALAMIFIGLLLSTIGTDLVTGQQRMTFGLSELSDGVDFAVLAIGLIGFSEIIRNLEQTDQRWFVDSRIGRLLPNRQELKQSAMPIVRGTFIGSLFGILPGSGPVLGPFASYSVEKKLSRHPERFGKGAIEGVAGPESANNAAAQTSFIPLLTLGIPPNAVMAVMIGAMTIHGIMPGPQVMTRNPDLFWGMIASMWVGNLMLLVINLPMIGIWVRLLQVPYRLMFPAILIFACIGIYSVDNDPVDVIFAASFGMAGYLLIKLGFEPAPLLLGFVLGVLMEQNFRRAMIMSRGDLMTFIDHPVSAALLVLAVVALILTALPKMRQGRVKVFTE